MNPNSRQVYTCISSADELCRSQTAIFFEEVRGESVGKGRGAQLGEEQTGNGREGEGWICVSIKFSLKPNLHPDVQMLLFESPKSEVKRNVQMFHFLTGGKQKEVV